MEFNFSTLLSLIFTLYVLVEIIVIKRLFKQKNAMIREPFREKSTKEYTLKEYVVTFLKMHPFSKPFSRGFNYRMYELLITNVLITTITSRFLNIVSSYLVMFIIDLVILIAMLIFKLSRRKSIEWMLKSEFEQKMPRQILVVRQFHIRLYIHQLLYSIISFSSLVALGYLMYRIYETPKIDQVIASTATILVNCMHRLLSLLVLSMTLFVIDKNNGQYFIHYIDNQIRQDSVVEPVPIESEQYNARAELKMETLQENTQENLNNQEYIDDMLVDKITKRAEFATKRSVDFDRMSKCKVSNDFGKPPIHASLPPIVLPSIQPSPQHISPIKFNDSIKSIKFNSLTVKRQKPTEQPLKQVEQFQAENQPYKENVLNEVSMNCNMDEVATKPLQKYETNLDDTIRRKSRNRHMESRPMSCQDGNNQKENQPKSYFTNSLLPPLSRGEVPNIVPHILPPLQANDFLQTRKLTQSDDQSYQRKKRKRRHHKKFSEEEAHKQKSPYLEFLPKILKKQEELRNSSFVQNKSKSQKRKAILKQTMQLQIIKKTISSDIDTVYT